MLQGGMVHELALHTKSVGLLYEITPWTYRPPEITPREKIENWH